MLLHNKTWLRHANKIADKIEAMSEDLKKLTDEQLREKTNEFKERFNRGESLDSMLTEAFAVAREAAVRVTGMNPYRVQIIGGIALHEGKIAEMKTGEGKTLVSVLPAYLNAITGKGVHIVTVNDYLAERDANSMGKIHEFLGLTVGVILDFSTQLHRKKAYACDVTYITNTQVGFDYLRDNLASRADDVVQRPLNFAIIDEVDSVLIDEARTPLILSGNGEDVSKIYLACDECAKHMKKGTESKEFNKIDAMLGDEPIETGEFIIHEKERNITLTADGVKAIETWFGLDNYADPKNAMIQHVMDLALRANYIMKRDKDYIVRKGAIMIVDPFTGRIMEDRQYSDGLHQAIEAKERVEIKQVNATVATTTYQNFFNKYEKIAGMTGTAFSERKEFKSTYHLDTIVIPTNKPMIRVDHSDVFYLTEIGKFKGVIADIKRTHEKGQPVLVGTASVETSEKLSALLTAEGILHQVLNAKQDAHEAAIVAKAGIHGTVTVATNMAGRGTDILLDEESVKAGGLKVIGTERHESQRIDNQLRGRAGRQGDPGESIFYLSAEDRLMLFGTDRFKRILSASGFADDEPITTKFFTSAIKKAQKKIEDNNFGVRKSVLEYDRVNDKQRSLIYAERRKLLFGENATNEMQHCMNQCVVSIVEANTKKKTVDTDAVTKLYESVTHSTFDRAKIEKRSKKAIIKILQKDIADLSNKRYKDNESLRIAAEQRSLLAAIDSAWMEQLKALDFLKQDIWYSGFAQVDPKSAYAIEAFELYSAMKTNIYRIATYLFFAVSLNPISETEITKDGV